MEDGQYVAILGYLEHGTHSCVFLQWGDIREKKLFFNSFHSKSITVWSILNLFLVIQLVFYYYSLRFLQLLRNTNLWDFVNAAGEGCYRRESKREILLVKFLQKIKEKVHIANSSHFYLEYDSIYGIYSYMQLRSWLASYTV